ncbi:MAG: YraN family protein [Fuerstiella sp.]|nr:YraN family protein [Fuerstiella sp.]
MKRFLHKLLGDRGERAAVRFLKKAHFRIIARQYRNQFGEIDIIAMDGSQIVFVEVKTRQSTDAGQPHEAVDLRKQQKLTKLALAWLRRHKRLEQSARFDVISIVWPDDAAKPAIENFKHAFEATGSGQFFS